MVVATSGASNGGGEKEDDAQTARRKAMLAMDTSSFKPVDATSLTSHEHGNTLVEQAMTEMMKQRGAAEQGMKVFQALESAGDLAPLPPYEAPDRLNERARGWLKHIHRKATTADDWSSSGIPHPWWDRYSGGPMTNFPRFDLQESSYAMALMADRTPAWREVYAETLDGLVQRYTQFWAAVDWLTQFGDDPDRGKYPPPWKGSLIPTARWGEYNSPGWTANGTNPYPTKEDRLANPFVESSAEFVQSDPIRAEAMLFFKGWLLLNMGLYARVSGDTAKWNRPWHMCGVGDQQFEWTHGGVAEFLMAQWKSREAHGGIH